MTKTKFYTFKQNNSGGRFTISEIRGIDYVVIVEANTATQANIKAEDIGIYFNGCDDEVDCPCCGDRWYPADENDGADVPSLYGDPITEGEYYQPTATVHYTDGHFKQFTLQKINH